VSQTAAPRRPVGIGPWQVCRWLGIALAAIAYPVVAHYSSSPAFVADRPLLSAGIALLPAVGLALWLSLSSGRGGWKLVSAGVLLGLLWFSWPFLERNFHWIYFIQHAGSNAALACFFGRTLGRCSVPLVARMAESVCGPLSPALSRYTRRVTLAWSLFFAANAAISALLFRYASLEAWSLFANILSLPLLALMFTLEYQVRLRLLPDERHRPLDALRAYRKITGRGVCLETPE